MGPGGGQVGAVLVSPFIKSGTVSKTPYNHYALLASIEDFFDLEYLGYAGQRASGSSERIYSPAEHPDRRIGTACARHRFSIMNPTLGAPGLAAGERRGEIDETIGISISDRPDHEHQQEHRGENEPPVSAFAGAARTIHLGSSDFLDAEEVRRF